MNPISKRVITGIVVSAAVVSAILFAPSGVFPPVCGLLAGALLIEFLLLLKRKLDPRSPMFTLAVFVAIPVILLPLGTIAYLENFHPRVMLLYVLAIVKFSDTGGFAFGLTSAKLMKGGNHKLCPTISPNKSWEGLFGSVALSCGVSAAFIPWTRFGVGRAVLFGVTAAFVGTFGDLVESKFKRWVGVKDSSAMKITNGMGGFLDMFDSLLFALPVLTVMLDRG